MRITIRVIPRAKKERVEKSHNGLKVYVSQAPVDGKANKRLLEVLAAHLKVKRSSLSIVKGTTSRDKIIEIK
ncbi:DUF167 domain-containing protein [Candidatus Omnitrophota bacterium]